MIIFKLASNKISLSAGTSAYYNLLQLHACLFHACERHSLKLTQWTIKQLYLNSFIV